jgi:hypothetical protein
LKAAPSLGAIGEVIISFGLTNLGSFLQNEFSAQSAKPGAFSSPVGDKDLPAAASGFLGKVVSTVHENLEYWEQTFEADA